MQQPAIFQEQGLEESPVLVPDVDVLANCYLVAGQLLHQSEVPRYPGSAADVFFTKVERSYVCKNMNKH